MALSPPRVLALLEQLEAARINIGLYDGRVAANDIREAAEDDRAASVVEIVAALAELRAAGEVIEWRPGCFRSRVGETVRAMRLLRQRFWGHAEGDDALLVEDVRVQFRPRHRPDRNAVSLAAAVPARVPAAIREAFVRAVPFETVSRFQADATAKLYACAQAGNVDDESFIVAGDTGAGKTEAFLFPILLDIASEPPELRARVGVRAVLVYPRIRLARNQLSRLLRYLDGVALAGGPRLKVGIQNGDVPASGSRMADVNPPHQRDGRAWHKITLIENCVTCGAGSYWVAADDPALDTGCPDLRCDRCGHTMRNLMLTQAALASGAPDVLLITDVSLSQWLVRERFTHLWGLWAAGQETVPPRFIVLDEVHLHEQIKGAHVSRLIKRFQARVRLAHARGGEPRRRPVVVGVSATLQDERRFLAKLMDIDPQDTARYERLHVIKPRPRDLVATEGRERYLFVLPMGLSPTPRQPQNRVNDQTAAIQLVMAAMHNLKTGDARAWAGVAFFDSLNDLGQFRHNYDGRLRRMSPPANQAELWRIRTDRSSVAGNGQNARSVPTRCSPDSAGPACARRAADTTLHECPHFQSGDCWVFAHLHGYNRQLTLSGEVYAGSAAALDGRDLIVTSPSLEVGYDSDAIQFVYQHKGPPSTASFIQRRGRAGRDPDDSPVILTLLWPYQSGDSFYFYHPEALYDPAFDDVPLNAGNFHVQRTHALLAMFDLLACLRRQNEGGLADDPAVPDFVDAGNHLLPAAPEVLEWWSWEPDPKRSGHRRVRYQLDGASRDEYFSGKHISGGHVQGDGGRLLVKGWLGISKGLARYVLKAAWRRLGHDSLLTHYLNSTGIATVPFQHHSSYPFRTVPGAPPSEAVPLLVERFGDPAWHDLEDGRGGNWIKSFWWVDWMLQGDQEATTVSVQHAMVGDASSDQRVTALTFGVTDLLPGNVTYRLRDPNATHWTPIPRDGESTFLYPRATGGDAGNRGAQFDDLTSKAESIFGVSRYLDDVFPGLQYMKVTRLRALPFGARDHGVSPWWYYDPAAECAARIPTGGLLPQGGMRISRRTSASTSAVVVPYVAHDRNIKQRSLGRPLDALFGAVDGYVSEGSAMLGFTRLHYEMRINLRLIGANNRPLPPRPPLRRLFYPPEPRLDEAGRAQPILVGYSIETHGISFQVNPAILRDTADAIGADPAVRLRLRRNCALYHVADYARLTGMFPQTVIDAAAVAIEYWLRRVVPGCTGEPRLLDHATDATALGTYFAEHRNVRAEEVSQFRDLLTPEFLTHVNTVLERAFRTTEAFDDFVQSVTLHSLATLLKELVARLGGVSTDHLVVYADLPLLEQVDRSITPRILVMETTEGGSGAIAQAFDRLDLTDQPGSLWWMLQTEMGNCPIANGEALVRFVLTHVPRARIEAVQGEGSPEALGQLLAELDVTPAPGAAQVLGRVLFNRVASVGRVINPPLVLKELFDVQRDEDANSPWPLAREGTIRRASAALAGGDGNAAEAASRFPSLAALRAALAEEGASSAAMADVNYELGVQLMALYDHGCEDGCPVCVGAGSDIEHYHVAPLLNSRLVLAKLRQILLSATRAGTCLSGVVNALLDDEPVRVDADPGEMGDSVRTPAGVAVVTQAGDDGQLAGTSAIVVAPEQAADFFSRPDAWERRWGGPEFRRVLTEDGTHVRSRAEALLANWLYRENIAYVYEPALAYRAADGKTRYIHPDFHLYEHDLYIEYWGRDDKEYLESRRFKESVYALRNVKPLHIEKNEVDTRAFEAKIRHRMASPDASEASL